jgi:hypothetical protein
MSPPPSKRKHIRGLLEKRQRPGFRQWCSLTVILNKPPQVLENFAQAYICRMRRHFSHLLGTIAMLLTMLLWLSLLNPAKADHFVDSLAGSQHEYKIVLGAALLSTVFSFIAAIRGSKWWYLGMALSSGTLAFFTYSLSV